MPENLFEGIDLSDTYRMEQKVAMPLYLDQRKQTLAEYRAQQADDPLNKEFNSMKVLKVSCVQPKSLLMPQLDKRLVSVVSHANFFPQMLEFAKEIQRLSEERNEDLEATLKLQQHPLVRAIGVKETFKFLKDVSSLFPKTEGPYETSFR